MHGAARRRCRRSSPSRAGSGPVARLLPTTAATTLRKGRGAAGDRRAVRRDQGAAARLLHRRLRRRSRRRSRSRASWRGQSAAAPTRSGRSPLFRSAASRQPRVTDIGLDRRGADLGAAPGGRRAAALFPRSRHRRGGVPGGLPARAEELAAERPAARSGGLADHGRPQRRASTRRGAGASRQPLPDEELLSDLDDAEARAGRAARRRALPRRHPAAAVHLLPSRAAGHAADRAGAAHRLRPLGQADRARLPGRRERRWSSASPAPSAASPQADVPFETPGAVERAERLAAVAAMIYLAVQRGLFRRAAARRARARRSARRRSGSRACCCGCSRPSRRSWGWRR